MGGSSVGDFKILVSRALPAAVNFVLIGGAPIMLRWDGGRCFCFVLHILQHLDSGGGVNPELFGIILQLFTRGWGATRFVLAASWPCLTRSDDRKKELVSVIVGAI